VHEKAPHVKSVMLAGPRGVGKKMLMNAVCTETGSCMFDLTPATVAMATKYAGKAGLAMLLHMVFKVHNEGLMPRYNVLWCQTVLPIFGVYACVCVVCVCVCGRVL